MGTSELLVDDAHRLSPAAPPEEYVYGACSPTWHATCEPSTAVEDWLVAVESEGIERVCCLLAGDPSELQESALGQYYTTFGPTNVCHAPTADTQLIAREKLTETILPFLSQSVDQQSPVVVHCLSGVGRTGQVLAAWLVSAHNYSAAEAVEAVRQTGRDPMTVVDNGNATENDLLELLGSMPSLSP